MKKFTSLSFMLVAALMIFTSCSKDDDGAPALDVTLLEGTWNFTKSEVTTTVLEESETQSFDEVGTYEFNTDKTVVITEDGYTSEGTYSISGQTITIIIDEDTQTYDVKELTASKFTVSQTEEMEFLVKFTMVTTNYFSK